MCESRRRWRSTMSPSPSPTFRSSPAIHETIGTLILSGPRSSWRLRSPASSFDREHKGSLYARAGIADYWIVNLSGPTRRGVSGPGAGRRCRLRLALWPCDGAPPPMRASRRWRRRPQRFQSPTSCRSYAGASTWAPNVHGGLDIAPKPPPFVTPGGTRGAPDSASAWGAVTWLPNRRSLIAPDEAGAPSICPFAGRIG